MSDRSFADFATDQASVATGLVQLITDDTVSIRSVLDEAWPEVFRSWPTLRSSHHQLASALAPFVRCAIQLAEQAEAARDHGPGRTLELRDDQMLGAVPLRGQGHPQDLEDGAEDPGDLAVARAFADLLPRERALVALSVYVGLDDRALPWAMRWRPPRAASTMHRAHRDLLLTAAPQVIGHVPDAADSATLRRRVERVLAARADASGIDSQAEISRLQPRLDSLTQRRALPRPRPGLVVAAALVATLAVAGGTVAATHQPGVLTASAILPPPPTAEPGMRLTGYRSIVVSLPDSWGHNQIECGAPVANTTVYSDAVHAGPCLRRPDSVVVDTQHSVITFKEPPSSLLVVGRVHVIAQVGRYAVYSAGRKKVDGRWSEVVLIPRADVEFIVSSRQESVLDDVIDSTQVLADGYTTVPPCERLALRDAIGALDDAGLRVRLTQASTLSERNSAPPVTHQSIPSGQVVPVGTTVGLGFPSMN